MSRSFDLDPVERITAGAVGEPGHRTFFIQARGGGELVTLLAEKQQVQLLSTTLHQLLASLPAEEPEDVAEETLALEEPVVAAWRVGPMRLEVDRVRDVIVLTARELVEEDSDVESGEEAAEDEEAEESEEGEEAASQAEPEGVATLRGFVESDEAWEAGEERGERARFVGTRAQMRALAEQAERVCAAGRPVCELCGLPMDPAGHSCPALNGHRRLGGNEPQA